MLDVILGVICLILGLVVLFSSLPLGPRVIICVSAIIITKIISDKFNSGTPE